MSNNITPNQGYSNGQPFPPAPPIDPPKKKRLKWPWIVGGSVLAFFLLLILIGAIAMATGSAPPRTSDEVVSTNAVEETSVPVAEAPAEEQPAEEVPVETPEAQTPGGIDFYDARMACEDAISPEFPFGVDFHWFMQNYAETYDPATGEWFQKVGITATNQFNAELKLTAECYTTDAGVEYLVY